jgi:hypothetical protein
MKFLNSTKLAIATFLVASFLIGLASLSAQEPLSGAIFTTNADGTRVNQNSFPNKCDVYLDGGPGMNAPQGAAGLPDGDYYFQVTDPSGKTLLSTDPVQNRQIHVSDGIITGNSGAGSHVLGNDSDHPPARTVQLCDFLDTPNPGGVYKAWVTPVGDFVGDPTKVDNPCGHGCFHGFLPSASKTDNFKVKGGGPQPCLIVNKVLNGTWVGGWQYTITDPIGTIIQGPLFTALTKDCTVFNLDPGTYIVVESTVSGGVTYTPTANFLDGKFLSNPDDTILLKIGVRDSGSHEIIFYNNK